MALIKLLFDKQGIERKNFEDLFSIDDNFYIAVLIKTGGHHLRTSPFSRSSMVIKGPKYTRSVKIAREVLFELKASAGIGLYTAYSPTDPSYFVSGFETILKPDESNETAVQKISQLKQAWETTLERMTAAGIEIWSK